MVFSFVNIYFLACRPFSKEEMDKLYEIYAKMRHEKLKNYSPRRKSSSEDILYYTIEEKEDSNDDRDSTNSINKRFLNVLDPATVISLAQFLYT